MGTDLDLGTGEQGRPYRQFCRDLSERSPLATIAVEGTTHHVAYLNPAFARLVGRGADELIGRRFAEAVPEGEGNGCLGLLDRVFRTGAPEGLSEQEHRQLGPRPVYWSYAVWAILGEDERPAGVMIQVTDATETALFRRQSTAMNEALMLSSIRQHELAEAANGLNVRLQEAIWHKDRFLAVLSHELRTPLTPVLAAVELLGGAPGLDDESRELVAMIGRNAALEARLIDDLLDTTRIGQGRMNLFLRPVALAEVVARAIEVCRADLEAGEVGLDVDPGGGPLLVDADAGRLQQVFWNLLKNAIKFSPAGGRVGVCCRAEGEASAVVEVADRGVGIDAELLPRLFAAFQQGDEAQVRRFGGLGLGLAISKAIVELHGGTIAARSGGRGEGATFSVRLPLLAGERAAAADVAPEWAGSRAAAAPLRILLVEDHPDGGRAMGQILAADGHEVRWARDVASGLELAGLHDFDLLICDLGLPDGSGLDLMRTLRGRGSTLPGLTLSGYGQEQDVVQSRDAGFARHLTKPVDFRALRAAVREVAGQIGFE